MKMGEEKRVVYLTGGLRNREETTQLSSAGNHILGPISGVVCYSRWNHRGGRKGHSLAESAGWGPNHKERYTGILFLCKRRGRPMAQGCLNDDSKPTVKKKKASRGGDHRMV